MSHSYREIKSTSFSAPNSMKQDLHSASSRDSVKPSLISSSTWLFYFNGFTRGFCIIISQFILPFPHPFDITCLMYISAGMNYNEFAIVASKGGFKSGENVTAVVESIASRWTYWPFSVRHKKHIVKCACSSMFFLRLFTLQPSLSIDFTQSFITPLSS